MQEFNIKLAEIPFHIKCIFESTKEFCSEYMTNDFPLFTVEITRSDIDNEREISKWQDIQNGVPIQMSSDNYLETIALYRKIAGPLLKYNWK